jgi:glycosidase
MAHHDSNKHGLNTQKVVIYQVFTRLFGNKKTANIPYGSKAQNGVGTFEDINDAALRGLVALGVTHLWLTGVPHHALIADYNAYGISDDDPDVVKGRAGSPYAVKDYYSVNPDLAKNPAKRMDEFRQLVARAQRHGLKVMIDIVPNHVARRYESKGKPAGVRDFGADDNTTLAYHRDNDFYYIPGKAFEVPDFPAHYQALGGEAHPLADGKFAEYPARWTGNGAAKAKPDFNDWYETVKINYGVKPDGSYDFPRLPANLRHQAPSAHWSFWQHKDVPSSWLKFRDITQFWLAQGVDGFRYDMAEMVPVEFWSYLNSHIKATKADAVLLAEVYQPALYRDYIQLGLMDYLYDKVGFYDSLRALMTGQGQSAAVLAAHEQVQDIKQHMLHFLENHDEQRIASPEFAKDPRKGLPAMVISSLISPAPTLVYFAQEVGEDGSEAAGFGQPSRTSIFDYIGVPAHQAWMNNGKFDGGALSPEQAMLRRFYQQLLRFSQHPLVRFGDYRPLPTRACAITTAALDCQSPQLLAFARIMPTAMPEMAGQAAAKQPIMLVVANFSDRAHAWPWPMPWLQQQAALASGQGASSPQAQTSAPTGPMSGQWQELFSQQQRAATDQSAVALDPWQAQVWVLQP